jgi:hypothetical protein
MYFKLRNYIEGDIIFSQAIFAFYFYVIFKTGEKATNAAKPDISAA